MINIILINPGTTMSCFKESCGERGINLYILFDANYSKEYKHLFLENPCKTIDFFSKKELIKFIKEIKACSDHALYVIGCHDNIICDVSSVCLKLNIPYTSPESVELCRYKYQLRQLINFKNIEIDYGDISGVEFEGKTPKKYPIICKPKRGWGSNWAEKIKSLEDFNVYMDNVSRLEPLSEYSDWFYGEILNNGYYWEEWINGPVITAELFIDKSRAFVPMLSIAHQFSGTCYGAGTLMPFIPPVELLINIEAVLERIILKTRISHGVFDIEMKLVNGQAHVIDINPRPMGGEMVTAFNLVSNISFSDLYIRFFIDKENPSVSYSGYASTHKIMADDTVSSVDVLEYLKQTNAITYVKSESLPFASESILARYVSVASDPYSCIDIGKTHIRNILSITPIKYPNYEDTEKVISEVEEVDEGSVNGKIVSFTVN